MRARRLSMMLILFAPISLSACDDSTPAPSEEQNEEAEHPEPEPTTEPEPTSATAPPVAPNAPSNYVGTDEAYCQLFAERIRECMPNDERTPEQEIQRCIAGRVEARLLGRWSDDDRDGVVRCLRLPDCGAVTQCMRQGPPSPSPSPSP